jgi:AcrR family transcriptional regulator
MLFEALERLLKSRSIDQLSVSDITDAATLNRATFYDHYTDKFALLEGLVEARFQELMSHRGVVFDGGCTQAILGIISTTCDYLAAIPGVDCPERRQMEKHFEAAIIDVVRGMILSGLQHHPPPNPIAPELIAAVVSGAIYGGAREWVRTPDRRPAREVVDSIFTLVSPILAPPPSMETPPNGRSKTYLRNWIQSAKLLP